MENWFPASLRNPKDPADSPIPGGVPPPSRPGGEARRDLRRPAACWNGAAIPLGAGSGASTGGPAGRARYPRASTRAAASPSARTPEARSASLVSSAQWWLMPPIDGHEQHRGRQDPGDVLGVVAGARGHHLPAAGTDRLGGLRERPHQLRVAGGGNGLRQGLSVAGQRSRRFDLAHQRLAGRLPSAPAPASTRRGTGTSTSARPGMMLKPPGSRVIRPVVQVLRGPQTLRELPVDRREQAHRREARHPGARPWWCRRHGPGCPRTRSGTARSPRCR